MTHMLYVWYIYIYLPTKLGNKNGVNGGIHIPYMEHMGDTTTYWVKYWDAFAVDHSQCA